MAKEFDGYHKWLGILPAEQPPNHYRLLGVAPFESDADVIANAADQRMAHVRTFQSGQFSNLSQQILNEIAQARITLLNAEKKAAYDEQLRRDSAPARAKKLVVAQPLPAETPTTAAHPAAPIPVSSATVPAAPSAQRTLTRRSRSSSTAIAVVAGGIMLAILGYAFLFGKGSPIASRPPSPPKKSNPSATLKPSAETSDKPQPSATPGPETTAPDVTEKPASESPTPAEKPTAETPSSDKQKPAEGPAEPATAQPSVPAEPAEAVDVTVPQLEEQLETATAQHVRRQIAAAALELACRAVARNDAELAKSAAIAALRASRNSGDPPLRKLAMLCALDLQAPMSDDTKQLAADRLTALRALPQPSPKEPAPSAPAQEARDQAMAAVKEIYGPEEKQAKTVEQKLSLANKILRKARESKDDPAAHYALLCVVRDMAASAANVGLANVAQNELDLAYAHKPWEMRHETFDQAAAAAKTPEQHRHIAEFALHHRIPTLLRADEMEHAERVAQAATEAARKTGDKELAAEALAMKKAVSEIARVYTEWDVKGANTAIDANPTDAEANAKFAKFQCLVKGTQSWDSYVLHFAFCDDPQLKSLALKELAEPDVAQDQLKLADEYWDLAAKHSGAVKKGIDARAGYWYQQALPELSGLTKDRVEARLKEAPAVAAADPHEDGGWAATVHGTYQVMGVEKKGGKRAESVWELRQDKTVWQGGRQIGRWTPGELQIRVTFSDSTAGDAVLKRKTPEVFVGGQTRKNGEMVTIQIQRLAVVAVWQHRVSSSSDGRRYIRPTDQPSLPAKRPAEEPPRGLKFWSNGRIDSPDGKAMWTMLGNKLRIAWGDGRIDDCQVSADGLSYHGVRSSGGYVTGVRLESSQQQSQQQQPQESRPLTAEPSIYSVSSESANMKAIHAIDGDPRTCWHTRYDPRPADNPPHTLVIDLGRPTAIAGVKYLPRQDSPNVQITPGRIAEAEIYCSQDPKTWGEPAATVNWPYSPELQTVRFATPVTARYLKIVVTKAHHGGVATIAELSVF